MNRRRIAASDIFSIPESASLDTMLTSYPSSVEASILDNDGDVFLRVAASKSKEKELSEEDIKSKIQEWKDHNKEHATSAGFRKANRGRASMDPRRFALQLAEVARLNASRYGSHSLARLAKKLKWVAGQSRDVAAKALSKIAAPLEENQQRQDQRGMPVIQKPPEEAIPGPEEFDENSELNPGAPIEYSQDRSWSSEDSGRTSRKKAKKENKSDLATLARDFLQEYKATNSLYDDDELLEQIQDPTVFESWLLDLDRKGRDPDPAQLDEAWNQALNELPEGALGKEDLTEFFEGEEGKPINEEKFPPLKASRSKETIQDYTAPGGDWANTMIRMAENPVMDRYLRQMHDKREAGRVGKTIEVENEIAEAVDQCLDHFAGEMIPSEISAEHVRQFIEENFPDVDDKKVYKAIQDISDPKKRNEDEPKERTNQEASRKRADLSEKDGQNGRFKGLEFGKGGDKISGQLKEDAFKTIDAAEKALEAALNYLYKQDLHWCLEFMREFEQTMYRLQRRVVESSGQDNPEALSEEMRSIYKEFDAIRDMAVHFIDLSRSVADPNHLSKREGEKLMGLAVEIGHTVGDMREGITKIFRRGASRRRTTLRNSLRLKGHREICACCRGVGESREGCCGHCGGTGQKDVSILDEDIDEKEKMASRLGSLLLVSVDVGNRSVSNADRQDMARVTRRRVASKGAPIVFKHSSELMRTLVENDIPYRTVGYRHPRYRRCF
jgi:hypothetical protein